MNIEAIQANAGLFLLLKFRKQYSKLKVTGPLERA